MAIRAPIGGGNLIEFFALGTNALATKQTHVADHNKTTKGTGHPNKKTLVWDIDTRFADDNWNTFQTTYLTNQDLSLIMEEYEDGSQESYSPASTSQSFGYVIYFGVLGTRRKVYFGVGVLTGNSGDVEVAGKAFEKSSMQITAVPAAATYSIATTIWNTSKLATTSLASMPTQIAADSYGAYVFGTSA